MLLRRLSLLLALAWMGVLFYLSHQPALDLPMLFPGQDKLFHAGTYGLLGGLWLMAMPWNGGYRRHQVLLATLIASLYGISDEFHQSFVPGRTPEVADWLADTLGALLATTLLAILSHQVKRIARP
ncbi:MAG TPA: VanZ family protein [Gammaproteobacteria bacterium]|nr:VanZ family protein [Gammaproteobacteria bacterium]